MLEMPMEEGPIQQCAPRTLPYTFCSFFNSVPLINTVLLAQSLSLMVPRGP